MLKEIMCDKEWIDPVERDAIKSQLKILQEVNLFTVYLFFVRQIIFHDFQITLFLCHL